jgi:DNA-directed RNA polymerase subunit K/omega
MTSQPIMTKFEYTRIRGIRLQQLSDGMKPLVPVFASDTYVDIFNRELSEGKIPFKLIRTIGFERTIAIPISEMDISKYISN